MKKQTWSHNLRQEQELQCSLEPQMNPLGTDLLGTTRDLELSVLRIYIVAEPNPKYFWRFSPPGESLIQIKDHVLSLVLMHTCQELMVIRGRDFLCLPSQTQTKFYKAGYERHLEACLQRDIQKHLGTDSQSCTSKLCSLALIPLRLTICQAGCKWLGTCSLCMLVVMLLWLPTGGKFQ